MKKLFTLILFFGVTTFFAQTPPIIESTYYPVRNTSIKQVWDITPNSMSVPSVGPNQVWDYRFSNNQFLNVIDTFQFKILTPTATPYSQYFPNATQAVFINTPFNNYSDSLYNYFKIDQNGVHNMGGFNIQNKYDSTIIYSRMEHIAPSEITYLSSMVDTAVGVGYANNYMGYKAKLKARKIKTETYIGYGTLKLPNGTYGNVALMKESYNQKDSIFLDLSSTGNYTYFAGVQSSTSNSYKFLRNNTFGSAWLMLLVANPANTQVDYGWYTLPVDFGSITGTVYTNTSETIPVTSGEVFLYRENSNFAKNDILAKSTLDASGNYKFDSIPFGEYRVAVRPNLINYPTGKITYYGDTTNWIDASSIITTTTTSPGHKIHLQHHGISSGLNNINGQIGLNLNIMRTNSQILLVKPIPSIGIVVKKNPGSSAERIMVTDTAGKFSISALNDGSYTMFVDIPGLHMAGTYSFTVAGGNIVNGLDFTVGTDSIHPISSFVGIKEIKNTANSFMTAFPNPYTSNATIILNLPESSTVLLEVYNVLGQKIQTLDNATKQTGTYQYNFSAKNLNQSTGMYFLKLTAGNKTSVLKLIEQ